MFKNLLQTYEMFEKYGVENPLLEIFKLCDLLSKGELRKLDFSFLKQMNIDLIKLVEKRKEGMPLEYIMGAAPFMGYMLYCSQETLIPREETELLVNVALEFIKNYNVINGASNTPMIIDLGTGCGNIAVALALNTTGAKILASDICPSAIEIAQKNVNKYDLQERVSLFCGDLFSSFHGLEYEEKIDFVISNPPYIPKNSLSKLPPEIINYEPHLALDAGFYGIDFYRRLIGESLAFLKPKGELICEIGLGQERLVTRLLERKGTYENIRYFKNGSDIRVISATKK